MWPFHSIPILMTAPISNSYIYFFISNNPQQLKWELFKVCCTFFNINTETRYILCWIEAMTPNSKHKLMCRVTHGGHRGDGGTAQGNFCRWGWKACASESHRVFPKDILTLHLTPFLDSGWTILGNCYYNIPLGSRDRNQLRVKKICVLWESQRNPKG